MISAKVPVCRSLTRKSRLAFFRASVTSASAWDQERGSSGPRGSERLRDGPRHRRLPRALGSLRSFPERSAHAVGVIQPLGRRLSAWTQSAPIDRMIRIALAFDDAALADSHVHAATRRTFPAGRGEDGPQAGPEVRLLPCGGDPPIRQLLPDPAGLGGLLGGVLGLRRTHVTHEPQTGTRGPGPCHPTKKCPSIHSSPSRISNRGSLRAASGPVGHAVTDRRERRGK